MAEKKTKGVCAFCGRPIYLSRYDEETHRGTVASLRGP